jgi:hypothetical protein
MEQCGLFVKSDRPYISGSPDGDGIVSYNCCPTAVLEIKCPFKLVDKSVKDGWKNWEYLNMNDKQILELSQKHPYYIQLQRQMAVTGPKWDISLCGLQKGHYKPLSTLIQCFGFICRKNFQTFSRHTLFPIS